MAWSLILVAMIAGFLPTAVWAQWTHAGDATVQGSMGVGTQTPARQMHVRGENAVFRMDRDRDGPAFMLVETALGNFNTIWKTFVVSTVASGVNNGQFVINDLGTAVAGAGTRRLTIANDGRIGNTTAPAAGLHIKNPTAGDLLLLASDAGSTKLLIQNDGDLFAYGADLELRLTSVTPGSYAIGRTSTLLANTTDGTGEDAFLALNGDAAIISSPGDSGLLRIQDSDNNWTNYRFNNDTLEIGHVGDVAIFASKQGDAQELILSTTGEEIQFVADSDSNTVQMAAFTWYNNGRVAGNRLMELFSNSGSLHIKGALTQNYAFDLAEAYWKSDAAIEAGDVVCIDPEQPNAVVLASAANARAVIGVVSTDPGLIMGGSAFSVENLTELWGDDVAAQFASERQGIEEKLLADDAYLQSRSAQAAKMKSALAKNAKSKDAAAAKAACESEGQQLAEALEGAALEAFCEEHLALVAMAGRVPVKVVAAAGAIRVGDLLVASATAGKAMRADDPVPGTVIGKALESFDGGEGTIMMMVLNR